jgi:hypothetical protein
MSEDDPFDDINKLRVPPELLTSHPRTPRKILKRQENFIMMPMWWWERLADCQSGHTYRVALFLLHLDWRNDRKPFKLANGMLDYDDVSRSTKWRTIRRLEKLGLITIKCRLKKSPVICVRLEP